AVTERQLRPLVGKIQYIQRSVRVDGCKISPRERDFTARVVAGVDAIADRNRRVWRGLNPLTVGLVVQTSIQPDLSINAFNSRRVRQGTRLCRALVFRPKQCRRTADDCTRNDYQNGVRPNLHPIHETHLLVLFRMCLSKSMPERINDFAKSDISQ